MVAAPGGEKEERSEYVERTYRDFSPRGELVPFTVSVKETDLYVRAERDLSERALEAALRVRAEIESYMDKVPAFRTSLVPLPPDPFAPPIVREMLRAGRAASVGPMAAVAGAVAEGVGRALLPHSRRVVVENGGDVFLAVQEETTVGLFAGESPLSMRIGIRIPPEETPCGVCTSSGKVGPSLSFGKADAVTVWAASTALADAVATATANRIVEVEDMESSLEEAGAIAGVRGAVAILGDRIGLWGAVDVVMLEP